MPKKPGPYRLSKPIGNDHTDRRSKDWHKQPEIPPGLYYLTVYDRTNEQIVRDRLPVTTWTELRLQRSGTYGDIAGTISAQGARGGPSDTFWAVYDALEPATDLDSRLRYVERTDHWDGREILCAMEQLGTVCRADVEAAIAWLRAKEVCADCGKLVDTTNDDGECDSCAAREAANG